MEEKYWYVVSTYSGYENKVKEYLVRRVESMGLQSVINQVIVPEVKEVEIKDGVKKEKVKKLFPGYVLIEMAMTDEAWYIVRNTPNVTGFLGSSGGGAKPIPVPYEEIEPIFKQMDLPTKPVIATDLRIGDFVKVVSGPYEDTEGPVVKINLDNQSVTLVKNIFGSDNEVEISLSDVHKLV